MFIEVDDSTGEIFNFDAITIVNDGNSAKIYKRFSSGGTMSDRNYETQPPIVDTRFAEAYADTTENIAKSAIAENAGRDEINAVIAAAAQYDREKSWLGPMDVIHKPSFDSPKDRPMMAERYVKGQSSDATGEPYHGDVFPTYSEPRGFPVSMEEIALKQRYASETMAGACLADSPHQRQLTKQRILSNLQRQLQAKANEVEKLHRAVTILTLHPEFDMFLELNHLLDGIKL